MRNHLFWADLQMNFSVEQQLKMEGGRLVNLQLRGLPKGMKLWYGQEHGVSEDEVTALKWNAVRLMFAEPTSFWRMCWIRTEDDEWRLMEPTDFQIEFAWAYQNNRWNYVNKPRQAKQSTAAALMLLRDAMYGDSIKATIVAQKREVCDELMDRIIDAYTRMPEEFKNPLKPQTRATRERIEFANGNSITTITVGSSGPGVGLSRSRYLITEGCEMDSNTIRELTGKLLPGINKRPNARLIWETTPGAYGSQMYDLWRQAWAPKAGEYSRFNAVFLKWWKDPSYVLRHPDTNELMELGPLTEEEQKFMATHEGCTRHHIYFRRVEISNTFDNSVDAFNNKYPPGPLDGWSSGKKQIYDGKALDYLKYLRSEAQGTLEEEHPKAGVWIFKEPDPRSFYIMLVDPSNFGSHGDHSGISVFDVHTWEEVASWEGRGQPTEINEKLKVLTQMYKQAGNVNGNSVIVENNTSALIGAIMNYNSDKSGNDPRVINLFHSKHKSGRVEPGWRASKKSLDAAEGYLDEALKGESIILNAPTGIQQLIMFDGEARNTRVKRGRHTSHFDLARTYVMAAWALTEHSWPKRLTEAELQDRLELAKARDLDAQRERERNASRQLNKALRLRRGKPASKTNLWAPDAGISR